jgi:hypothetical protein
MEHAMPEHFDPVEYMDNLLDGGFSEKQAKTLTSALVQLLDSHLVTKDYFDLRLQAESAQLRAEMAQMKSEIIQWLVAVMVVQTGAIAVMFKFLH